MQAQPDLQAPFGMSSDSTAIRAATVDDINDQLFPVDYPTHEFPWVEAISGVVILLVVAAAVMVYRRRHRKPVAESLEHAARRRLAALAELAAPDHRAFHAELAA